MNVFHHICVTGECLEGGCLIGLSQVPDIDQSRIEIGAVQPSEVVLQLAPQAVDRVELWTIGRKPAIPRIYWPLKPLGGMCAAVIQEQDVEAVGKRVRERVDKDWEGLGIERGQLQNEAFAGGRGYSPIDVALLEGVLDEVHRLDAMRGEPASTYRAQAEAALVLAKDAYRARIGRW
jgi:hypothetical protein